MDIFGVKYPIRGGQFGLGFYFDLRTFEIAVMTIVSHSMMKNNNNYIICTELDF
jgi:hypothetical protein